MIKEITIAYLQDKAEEIAKKITQLKQFEDYITLILPQYEEEKAKTILMLQSLDITRNDFKNNIDFDAIWQQLRPCDNELAEILNILGNTDIRFPTLL